MPRDHDQEPDYEVGYGKPPHHTRFKPGVSGNPRGRPKDAKNLIDPGPRGAQRAGRRRRERPAAKGQQAPSHHQATDQPLGPGRPEGDADAARDHAGHRAPQ